MGLGIAKMDLEKEHDVFNDLTAFKQAFTAVGQIQLMNAYEEAFSNHGFHIGQFLVTNEGLLDKDRAKSIKNTLEKLYELNVIPIFNENDTVCPDEIEFGDNDRLSAMVAALVGAERLFLLTDCDGLYDKDPHKDKNAKLIREVKEITQEIKDAAGDSSTHVGLGGMTSKVIAAEIVNAADIDMHIVNVDKMDQIPDFISGEIKELHGTSFRTN